LVNSSRWRQGWVICVLTSALAIVREGVELQGVSKRRYFSVLPCVAAAAQRLLPPLSGCFSTGRLRLTCFSASPALVGRSCPNCSGWQFSTLAFGHETGATLHDFPRTGIVQRACAAGLHRATEETEYHGACAELCAQVEPASRCE
jgi:hypothetical protein